jgi:DNA-binding NarL/FixJ family response regulator
MSKPRVLLADDHLILAEGLRKLLEIDFEVVAVVADGRELLTAAKQYRPDVIVADVSMPLLNGIEAAMQLADLGVKAKVVFLTMHHDVAYARRALAAGAMGFVLKHSVASELITAIRQALLGQVYVTPIIAGELLQSYSNENSRAQTSVPRLTVRQRVVLQLLAEGHSAKEIAVVLRISTRTAEVHKARIRKTLGLASTADLVKYAIRNGIISV